MRHEICIVCRERVNVSKFMAPTTSYVCPRCTRQTNKPKKKLAKVQAKFYEREGE